MCYSPVGWGPCPYFGVTRTTVDGCEISSLQIFFRQNDWSLHTVVKINRLIVDVKSDYRGVTLTLVECCTNEDSNTATVSTAESL